MESVDCGLVPVKCGLCLCLVAGISIECVIRTMGVLGCWFEKEIRFEKKKFVKRFRFALIPC